ncbi:Phosphoglycolate phosphatase [Desulfurella amilsii]|uniref:phosphoglycolate phosphatase n=1 Tax=Desulfurella amilsii TaxID=1562698 RepID=A0A1X4XZR3_9BACT|nr:HAD-IA family hydrolase [Desulfurella amilsii]OSS43018.1 Phosphoglycolate phosphatase [Desulfurella amilsii]
MNNAIFFDLDGTLVDSKSDLGKAVVYTALNLKLKILSKEYILSLVGNGIHRLVRDYLDSIACPDYYNQFLNIFLLYYYDHVCEDSYLYDGVKSTLLTLKKHYKLFVVSNKLEKFSKKLLNELGIADFFEEIVGGDSFENKKPHPQPILSLIERHAINPLSSLFVGDSENDYFASKASNIQMGWISFGYKDESILKKITPDFIFDKFRYILNIAL